MKWGSRAVCRSMVLSAALLSSVGESAALAQPEANTDDRRARELFLTGDTAYAEGRYADALRAFTEAYELSGRPQLLFNLANCYERLGRNADAIDALEKYLATVDPKDRDPVEGRIVRLKRLEARQDAAGAKNEKERSGEGAPVTPLPAPAPTPGVSAVGALTETPSSPALPWILVGSGGAFVIAGSVFAILTLGARSDATAGCTDSSVGHLCDETARSALDREKAFGLVADVGIASGLLLGGIGTYLFVTRSPASAAVRLGIGNAQGGGRIHLRVTF
jgi:hypothetical protein